MADIRKGKFFGIIACLLLMGSAVPGTVFSAFAYPPRKEVNQMGTKGLMFALLGLLAYAIIVFFAYRAPNGRPFLGETRRSWLVLVTICFVVGFALGIGLTILVH